MPGGRDDGFACPGPITTSGRAVGAIAVLVAGCTAAGGGSGAGADRAGLARHSVAASPPGRVFHRIVTTPRPGSGKHGSGPGGLQGVGAENPVIAADLGLL